MRQETPAFDGRCDRDLPAKCLMGIRHGGSEEADWLSATGRKTPREKRQEKPHVSPIADRRCCCCGFVPFAGSQLGAKQVEFLHDVVPTAAVIGLLVNSTNPTQTEAQTTLTEAAAQQLGLRLHVVNASTASDFDKASQRSPNRRLGR